MNIQVDKDRDSINNNQIDLARTCHCGKDGHALNSVNCIVHGGESLTGQEWYDRFVKEWNDICNTIGSVPANDEVPFLYGRIAKTAAKKASGLE